MNEWMAPATEGAGVAQGCDAARARAVGWWHGMVWADEFPEGACVLSPNTEKVATSLAPAGHHRMRLVSNLVS